MSHTILLLSKDNLLLKTRALMLEGAGYRTLTASNLLSAVGLAFCCHLAIIDATFALEEHQQFVDRVHGDRLDLVVLSLRAALIEPGALIRAVTNCLATRPGGPKLVVIDDRDTPPCQEAST